MSEDTNPCPRYSLEQISHLLDELRSKLESARGWDMITYLDELDDIMGVESA